MGIIYLLCSALSTCVAHWILIKCIFIDFLHQLVMKIGIRYAKAFFKLMYLVLLLLKKEACFSTKCGNKVLKDDSV